MRGHSPGKEVLQGGEEMKNVSLGSINNMSKIYRGELIKLFQDCSQSGVLGSVIRSQECSLPSSMKFIHNTQVQAQH